jgi:transposase InsO family protein
VRYQFIKEQQGQHRVSVLCQVLQVGRGGYYAWRKREPSERAQANQTLTQKIRSVFEASAQTYGSPRIFDELQEAGIPCSEKRIARLMRLAELKAVLPKRFVVTTHSNPTLPVADNLLEQHFEVEAPDRKWTRDITYVWTGEGWLYLSVVLDLFSRRIVGWAMGASLERWLVLSALEMARAGRQPAPGLLLHSDRGSQYASLDYQQALCAAGMVCSMSRRGNCFDNAVTESFFATLKKELVYRSRFATRAEARSAIFAWIVGWYNRKRRHTSLGSLSPEVFERRYQQEQARAAAA